MKRLINFLFALTAITACLVPVMAHAEPVQIGSTLTWMISVCASKEDAIKIVDMVQQDKAAADKMFEENQKCANVPMTFKVGNVVHVVNIGNTTFFKVVEITDPTDDTMKLYWLTSKQIVKYKITNEV